MNEITVETRQTQTAIGNDRALFEFFQLSGSTLCHNQIYNHKDEKLGKLQDLMISLPSGTVLFAIMSNGGFLGVGERLLAIPWHTLTLDKERKCFVLPLSLERLKLAPSFDYHNWPDMNDVEWRREMNRYFGLGQVIRNS